MSDLSDITGFRRAELIQMKANVSHRLKKLKYVISASIQKGIVSIWIKMEKDWLKRGCLLTKKQLLNRLQIMII